MSITLQSDGKVLIGGAFGNYLARLNANGSPDFTFNTGIGANLNVNSLPLQPDGKVLIGGDFTAFNGSTHNYITRLNSDGSLDTSFNAGSGANAVVYSIALQPDGKALIGGNFTTYNGTFVNRIARIHAFQPCIPATPAAQPVSGIGNNTATLNWSTCNATGVTGYQVWVSGGIGVLNVGNVQSFSLNSLAAGTQYSWSVRALSGPTSSAWIPGAPFNTTGVPPCLTLPSGLVASAVTNTSASLGWALQTGVNQYQVWVSGFPVTTVSGNSYIANGLVSGTVYDWAVRSLCPSGSISNWASGQFTTTGAAACTAPTGLNATFVFPQSNFSWDAVAVPNVQYQIWIQGIGVFPSLISTNSFSTTAIPFGQTRSWSVRTLCPGGVITSWSSSVFTAARGSMAAGKEEMISVEEMIAADKMLASQLEGKPVVYPNPSLDRFMVVSYLESRFSILTLQGTTLVEGVLQEGTTEVIWPEGATEGVYLFQVQTERGAVREKLIRRR